MAYNIETSRPSMGQSAHVHAASPPLAGMFLQPPCGILRVRTTIGVQVVNRRLDAISQPGFVGMVFRLGVGEWPDL